ncbi:MAG: hypothetical protein AAGC90_03225 [Curtobacterium sp.]|jgi:hypothetical protein|uniref:hypothetical protein n=1 Tax=Curtobacterium sp. Curtsp57 TaxID=3243047 RepID=UPI0031A1B000
MSKVLRSVTFASIVTMGLVTGGSAVAAATIGTPSQVAGAFAVALAAAAGGCYLGTTIRHRRRARQR